jgi:hypothetical protein
MGVFMTGSRPEDLDDRIRVLIVGLRLRRERAMSLMIGCMRFSVRSGLEPKEWTNGVLTRKSSFSEARRAPRWAETRT